MIKITQKLNILAINITEKKNIDEVMSFFMSQEGTLIYTPQDPFEVDMSSVNFPVEIDFVFKNVDRAIPSKHRLILSQANALSQQKISFKEEDVESLKTLYDVLHSKVPGLPPNNHFFIFIDVNEPQGYSGFVSHDTHVLQMIAKGKSALITILNSTYYERALKLRGELVIPQELFDIMESPPPTQSQTALVINSAKAKNLEKRTRIVEGSYNADIVDVRKTMSLIAVDPFDNDVAFIPVDPNYKTLLIGINAALVCIEKHLYPRGRTIPLNEDLVREIVTTIIEEHAPHSEEDDDGEEDGEEDGEYSESVTARG